MKKCDIKGCKEKATVFFKTFCVCEKHYKAIMEPYSSGVVLKK